MSASASPEPAAAPQPAALAAPPTPCRWMGRLPYDQALRAMRRIARDEAAGRAPGEQVWMLEHQPVYTLGARGAGAEAAGPGQLGGIPLVASDRGGLTTYHGPGQLVCYPLVRLRRLGLGVRDLTRTLLEAAAEAVGEMGLRGEALDIATGGDGRVCGLYLRGAKIAAIGLRIRQGRCYHGLSLNCDLDLAPYAAIQPCGLGADSVGRLADWLPGVTAAGAAAALHASLARRWPLAAMTTPDGAAA